MASDDKMMIDGKLQNDPQRTWQVVLIGGASGTGKTSVSYRLARRFDVGLTEIDDLHLVLQKMTTPEQLPLLHYWHTHPEAGEWPAERILELHLAVSRLMAPALEAVIANHLETNTPVVLEGDYMLPSLAALSVFEDQSNEGRVKGAFLYEPDETQLVHNFGSREPEAGEQDKRALVSRLYGQWLKEEAARCGITALPARPWETILERIIAALD